jgi:hypothetical protein
MPTLVAADIWRDGGSLSAVVLQDNGESISYWLQTTSWNHPREAAHSNLFVSPGSNPELLQRKVEIRSEEERQLLELLDATVITECDEEGQGHFARMLSILHDRNDQKTN